MHCSSDIYLFGVMLILFIIIMLHVVSYGKKRSFTKEGFESCPTEDKSPYAKSLYVNDIQGLKGGSTHYDGDAPCIWQNLSTSRYSILVYWWTLIGAVRHEGWIPWDGDIDVGMLYKDYPKFLRAIKDELPSSMWLQTTETDPNYPKEKFYTYLPKLRHLHSCYKNCQDGVRFHNGFQLDICLYDIQQSTVFPLTGNINDTHQYPIDMIFPLEQGLFDGIKVYIPGQYKKYCIQNCKYLPKWHISYPQIHWFNENRYVPGYPKRMGADYAIEGWFDLETVILPFLFWGFCDIASSLQWLHKLCFIFL